MKIRKIAMLLFIGALALTFVGCGVLKDPAPSVSIAPSVNPSVAPSVVPSVAPSVAPSVVPTVIPSVSVTLTPTAVPSALPTVIPSAAPSVSVSAAPSVSATPTVIPTATPSAQPSAIPTVTPTVIPTATPSAQPSVQPSVIPTATPTITPTVIPTVSPSLSEEEKLNAIIFEDFTAVYDGSLKEIFVKNLPTGYSVRYYSNSLRNVGTAQAKAKIYRGNTLLKTLTATIEITPATFEGITFPSLSVPFSGKESVAYLSGLAAYPSAKVVYENNRLTDVGKITATATVTDPNYQSLTLTATVEVTPLTFTGISLSGVDAVYNGKEHAVTVSGLESYPSATVILSGGTRTEAGEQEATLLVTQRGYTDFTASVVVSVARAPLTQRVAFPDTVFVYTGKEHVHLATGLPSDVVPVYENNRVLNVGDSQTATLTVENPNYEALYLTALISVKKPEAVVTGIDVTKRRFVNDPSFYASVVYSDTHEQERLAAGDSSTILSGTLSFEKIDVGVSGLHDLTPYGLTSEVYDVIFKDGTVTVTPLETNLVAGGGKAGENGTMLYNGKEIHSMGVDYYSMFNSVVTGRSPLYQVEEGLATLKSYGVRVIRFNGGLFYANEAQKYYFGYEDEYFAVYDSVLNACAQNDILVIPSFFWSFWPDDYYGETYDQIFEDPATNTSQGYQFMMDYTRRLVERYQHHPSILAWEFGNEWNLQNDLPNWKDWMPCKQTVAKHTKFLEAWSALITEIDEYDRIITTGDSILRGSQYHQYTNNSWSQDTYAQHLEVLKMHNAGNITAVSTHVYGGYADGSKKDPTKVSTSGYLSDLPATTWEDYLTYMMNAVKDLTAATGRNFTSYVGETGIGHGNDFVSGDTKDTRIAKQKAAMLEVGNAMQKTGVPVALIWNYDHMTTVLFEGSYAEKPSDESQANQRGNGTEYSWNENFGKGRAMLEAVQETNEKLTAQYGAF